MRSLNDYTDPPVSELFKRLGSFFAFSNDQFNAARIQGIRYVNMRYGMFTPVGTDQELLDELDKIGSNARLQRMAEFGREAIISYELGNYESWYTGNIDNACECLEEYSITRDEVQAIYRKEYSERIKDI